MMKAKQWDVVLLPGACTGTPTLSETDEVAIYTAVIEQLYIHDDTFGGTYQAAGGWQIKGTTGVQWIS